MNGISDRGKIGFAHQVGLDDSPSVAESQVKAVSEPIGISAQEKLKQSENIHESKRQKQDGRVQNPAVGMQGAFGGGQPSGIVNMPSVLPGIIKNLNKVSEISDWSDIKLPGTLPEAAKDLFEHIRIDYECNSELQSVDWVFQLYAKIINFVDVAEKISTDPKTNAVSKDEIARSIRKTINVSCCGKFKEGVFLLKYLKKADIPGLLKNHFHIGVEYGDKIGAFMNVLRDFVGNSAAEGQYRDYETDNMKDLENIIDFGEKNGGEFSARLAEYFVRTGKLEGITVENYIEKFVPKIMEQTESIHEIKEKLSTSIGNYHGDNKLISGLKNFIENLPEDTNVRGLFTRLIDWLVSLFTGNTYEQGRLLDLAKNYIENDGVIASEYRAILDKSLEKDSKINITNVNDTIKSLFDIMKSHVEDFNKLTPVEFDKLKQQMIDLLKKSADKIKSSENDDESSFL